MVAAKQKYQQKLNTDNINRDTSVISGISKPISTTQNVSDNFVASK